MSRCMLGNKRFDCKEVYDKPYKDTGRQIRHLNDLVLGLLIYREELSETFRGGCGDAIFNFLPYISFLFILDFAHHLNPVLHF